MSTARRVAFSVVVALLALYPTLMFGVRLAAGVVVGDAHGEHGGRPAAALGAVMFLGLTACLVRLARRRDTVADAHAMTGYALAALVAQLIPSYSDGAGSIALFAGVALLLMPTPRRLLQVRPQPTALLAAVAAAMPLVAVGIARAHQVSGLTGDAAENHYDAAWAMLTIALLLLTGALDGAGAQLVRVIATVALAVLGIDSVVAPHSLFLGRPLGVYALLTAAAVAGVERHLRERQRPVTPTGTTGGSTLAQAEADAYS